MSDDEMMSEEKIGATQTSDPRVHIDVIIAPYT